MIPRPHGTVSSLAARSVGVGLAIVAILLTVQAAGQSDIAHDLSYTILPRATARIRSYNTLRYALHVVSTLWYLSGLWLAVHARLAQRTTKLLPLRSASVWFLGPAVWFALMTVMAVWQIPAAFAWTMLDRAYGLSTITWHLWLGDRLRDWAFTLVWAPAVPLALRVIERYPCRWWWITGTALAPIIVLMVVVYPVVVDTAYNKFVPLHDPILRSRLMDLAARAGIRRPQVLVVDSSVRTLKQNAYVSGLGPTKRIVLWDTTLRSMDPDMIIAVAAHELGHYARNHVWRGVVLNILGMFVILWILARLVPAIVRRHGDRLSVTSVSGPSSVPLFMLVLQVLLVLQMPVASAISRAFEHEADLYALETGRDGLSMARALASFSTRDYADPDPPKWMVYWAATHPPLRDRVALALDWALKHGAARSIDTTIKALQSRPPREQRTAVRLR